MSNTLTEIAQQLKRATHKRKAVVEKTSDVKVQLIYAFNGTGKTRLSREFKDLIWGVQSITFPLLKIWNLHQNVIYDSPIESLANKE